MSESRDMCPSVHHVDDVPATHFGLCAACFADLTPLRRRDLVEAEQARNPPTELVVNHTTHYVPTPGLWKIAMLSAIFGAIGAVVSTILIRFIL